MSNLVFRPTLPMVLLLAPAAALAQQPPKILVATGQEMSVGVLNPGTLECVNGRPAGSFLQCSPGTTRISVWNSVGVQGYQDVVGTAAAMFRGRSTVVMHCNLDGNYYGHCWGTFEMEVAEMGGKWVGAWSGLYDLAANVVSYRASGYGSGGQLELLRFEKESVWPGGPQPGTFVFKVLAKQPAR